MNTGWLLLSLLLTAIVFWRVGYLHGLRAAKRILESVRDTAIAVRRMKR